MTEKVYSMGMKTYSKEPLTQEEKDKLLAKSAAKFVPPTEKQWGVEYPYFSTALRAGRSLKKS